MDEFLSRTQDTKDLILWKLLEKLWMRTLVSLTILRLTKTASVFDKYSSSEMCQSKMLRRLSIALSVVDLGTAMLSLSSFLKKTIRQLQLGQNAAPATLTITKKSSQIKPVISSHYFKKKLKTALINTAGLFKTI